MALNALIIAVHFRLLNSVLMLLGFLWELTQPRWPWPRWPQGWTMTILWLVTWDVAMLILGTALAVIPIMVSVKRQPPPRRRALVAIITVVHLGAASARFGWSWVWWVTAFGLAMWPNGKLKPPTGST